MPSMQELQKMLEQTVKAQPKPKPEPKVKAEPPAVVEKVITVIRESENDFLEKIREELRFAVGEERPKVLRNICERIDALVTQGLGCEVRPNKANGKALTPMPDHGLRANAERIIKALRLETYGTTVDSLVHAVELSERPVEGAVQ